MKAFNFSNWKDFEHKENLLFFAQCLSESLFYYSHDSFKTPSLNFKFLCLEVCKTIQDIEKGTIDKANMITLFEEMESSFNSDSVAQVIFGSEFHELFYSKNGNGVYTNKTEKGKKFSESYHNLKKDCTTESSLKKINTISNYLLDTMITNNLYFELTKSEINRIVDSSESFHQDAKKIHELSRIFLSELINHSYSQEYLNIAVRDVFYNQKNKVTNVGGSLKKLWDYFTFEEVEYTVVLPLSGEKLGKYFNEFKDLFEFTTEENNKNYFANKQFKNYCKFIVKITAKNQDPWKAIEDAKKTLNIFSALVQYNSHNYESFFANDVMVFQNEKKVSIAPIPPLLTRSVTLKREEITQKLTSFVTNNHYITGNELIKAISLHSLAMGTNDASNQLLNLWTALEVLIEVERNNNYAKISQICNVLTTALNSIYIHSLILQLEKDLEKCVPEHLSGALLKITGDDQSIEKLIKILTLERYKEVKNEILDHLANYPLLKFRIISYSDVFSEADKVKLFLDNHRIRLAQQIRRIYRNRNMIIHAGDNLPYIDTIVQNLHYYVDALIDLINTYVSKGFTRLDTIYIAMQQDEYRNSLALERVLHGKMSEEEVSSLLLRIR